MRYKDADIADEFVTLYGDPERAYLALFGGDVTTWQQIADRLHRGGAFWYIWTKKPDAEDGVTHWAKIGEYMALPEDTNVWWGVHPVIANRGRYRRSTIETVAAVNCLFADLDFKSFETEQACKIHLANLNPKPSIVIFSGGGYHVYWLLSETFTLATNEDRQRARALQAAWQERVGGDPGAKHLTQILRVPGTKNLKPQYGPTFPTVKVVKCDLALEYDFDDLERLAVKPEKQAELPHEPTSRGFSFDDDVKAAEQNLQRLAATRCDTYHDWVNVGMCLAELGETGFNLWNRWSQQSAKYPSDKPELMRDKWATFAPGNGSGLTLASLAKWAQEDTPNYTARRNSDNGAGNTASGDKLSLSAQYVHDLKRMGYSFRLNLLADQVEVNGKPIDDQTAAEIRCKMRDAGSGEKNIRAIEDAYTAEAGKHSYHPVKDYLGGLNYQGGGHIERLASYFTEKPHELEDGETVYLFPTYLRRWLVGAVARVYTGAQNAVLVLDGGQGIGKSHFAKWLCPLPKLYLDAPIDPANKDCDISLISTWLWEVSELGATTRKADRESLKAFISRELVTVRKAYGRFPITKTALASFIGTINNEAGFLSDPTGSRRFNVVTIEAIDWNYFDQVDKGALWAEALALYRAGEPWQLTTTEKKLALKVNSTYEVREPIEDMLERYFDITGKADDFLSTSEIADRLQLMGYRANSKDLLMQVGRACQGLGLTKKRGEVDVLVSGKTVKKRLWGYAGIKMPALPQEKSGE